ncbi:MAG: 23S rRNA (uracil(1939)-C(5))-methyltransferase RlmD [Gammaproteobacteria bacterium]|nr:MAG: 23S rRNA (uracil(1939)-C(5))-methyltransferase RlmD [Gammaproteobacteria bacterium]
MSRRRQRKKLPTEHFKIKIESLSHEGRGVAHHPDGKTIFVDGALPGEEVEYVYSNQRAKFDEGRTVKVLSEHPSRAIPDCEFFGLCGGCSMQHLSSKAQIEHKQSILVEQLQHFGKTTAQQVMPPMQDQPWGYRRKARLGVKYVHKKDTVMVGFREKQSSFLANIDNCSILDPRVASLIMPLRELIYGLICREGIPQIEVACGDKTVALVFRHLQSLSKVDKQALKDFAIKHDLDLYLQAGGPATVTKLYPEEGEDRLSYYLEDFDLEMQFHPMDFTQVNAGINRKMLNLAIELLDIQPEDSILDLFCGLGNFSLPIARHAKRVSAVEGDESMVIRGRENSAHNKLDNLDFFAANLAGEFYNEPWATQGFDKLLIDPPRSGAYEICQHLSAFGAKRIVYVSCNPATLARDTSVLLEQGYGLKKIGVMDMFPQTAHVESIALFVKEP